MGVCMYTDLHRAGKAHKGPMEIWEFIAATEISKGHWANIRKWPKGQTDICPTADLVKSPQFKMHICF